MISIEEAILIIKDMDNPADDRLEALFPNKKVKIERAKYEAKKEMFNRVVNTLENLRDYPQVWEGIVSHVRHKNKPECIENAKWV